MMAVGERTTTEAAVVSTVLDYFEGWFDGDAARMERALHPDLAKRALATDGRTLDETTAEWMIDATGRGVGRDRDPGDRANRGRGRGRPRHDRECDRSLQRSTGSTFSSCERLRAGRS